VLNDTKVLPARLRGHKLGSSEPVELGGQVEFLLIAPAGDATAQRWQAMYRSSKPLRPGQRVRLSAPVAGPSYDITVVSAAAGEALLDFGHLDASAFDQLLSQLGEVPLPPYIERARERAGLLPDVEADRQRYQTVFAREQGSVAAPTAGLHFTKELLASLTAAGHEQVSVTLHIGPGTFMPLRSDSIAAHVMHSERYHIPEATVAAIAAARAAGRKILAVGTTVVRTLEAATAPGQRAPRPGWGETQLCIVPPYRFAAVDAMLTNFHLPRSTLLMLVAALAGRRRVLDAYAAAIAAGYRFYSFGDAMLIPRPLAEPLPASAPTVTP
jgi:S-adenosylmethionine:tRNA ribosyltransferase-isomerase